MSVNGRGRRPTMILVLYSDAQEIKQGPKRASIARAQEGVNSAGNIIGICIYIYITPYLVYDRVYQWILIGINCVFI